MVSQTMYRSSSDGEILADFRNSSVRSSAQKNAPPSNSKQSCEASTPPLETPYAHINAQPQDYVVVNGHPYRVTRSPRYSGNSSDQQEGRPDLFSSKEEICLLRQQLTEAEFIIGTQRMEISNQTKRIQELEIVLNNTGNCTNTVSPQAQNNSKSLRASPVQGLAARRRAESKHIITNSIDMSEGHKDCRSESNGDMDMDVISYITPTNSSSIRESLSASFSAPPSSKIDEYGQNVRSIERDHVMVSRQSPDRNLAAKEAPKGLAARLSMGPQERRKLAAAKRLKKLPKCISTVSENDNASYATSDSYKGGAYADSELDNDDATFYSSRSAKMSVLSSSSPIFKWKQKNRAALEAGSCPFLFIAHDNPQVGNTINSQISSEGFMNIMLESKDESDVTRFLVGKIIYSGDIESIEDVDLKNPRGSQFLICKDLQAIQCSVQSFPTRSRGDILEIGMDGLPKNCYIDVSSEAKLKDYLRPCKARVDVILDPSHTDTWYPYWEGRRKMAPQFRSKGVGYIRLGDDMSNYGTAFLSLDAGLTYLDYGATSIVQESKSFGTTFRGSLSSNQLTKMRTTSFNSDSDAETSRSNSGGGSRSTISSRGGRVSRPTSSNYSERSHVNKPRDIEEVRELLAKLKDDETKWNERADSLRRMYSNPACDDPSLITEVITIIMTNIKRQKNPHVLKAAVACVSVVGDSPAVQTQGVAWRSLLLETIHLLRTASKPVYEESLETLESLHGRSVSLGQLTGMIDDVLAGPRGRGTDGASNSAKVISWLDQKARVESNFLLRKSFGLPINTSTLSFDRVDAAVLFNKCRHLIMHREEATRDAVVGFVSAIIAYDIIQSTDKASLLKLLKKMEENMKSPSVSLTLMRHVSGGLSSSFAEIEKTAPRMYERIVGYTSQTLLSLISEAAESSPNMKSPRPSSRETAVTTSSNSRDSPILNTPPSNLSNSAAMQMLSNAWYECRLMLKNTPTTDLQYYQLSETVSQAPRFFSKLTYTANSQRMPIGMLLRIVLPFDEDTSSNDQSIVKARAAPTGYNIDPNSSEIVELREHAVKIRRLIRVKMADENDLKQAVTVCDLLNKFCSSLDLVSSQTEKSPSSLLQILQ